MKRHISFRRLTAGCIIAAAVIGAKDAGAASTWHRQMPMPEVAVTVFYAADGYQMEWDGDGTIEHGEEWCSEARCVNETLARIGAEWTYSVAWVSVQPVGKSAGAIAPQANVTEVTQ